IVVASRNHDSEVLLYTRLKQPFYGCQGNLSGKVMLGESVYAAARRELKEETNLEGMPTLFEIKHQFVHDTKTGIMLEDKFLFCFIVKNPTGDLSSLEEGRFEWVKKEDIRTFITRPFNNLDSMLAFIDRALSFDVGPINFGEDKRETENY
ncbi:NUDIX domain-containing protein, partial [Patescibacteria group bacterium]|nr:NUDIX domain-containing protein [Patescibacteria group bacterium]